MPKKTQNSLLIADDKYSKSNFLISSKYSSSLLENQILAISLADVRNFKEDQGVLISELKASDIIEKLNKNKGSFYRELNKVAQAMTTRAIGMQDPDTKVFDYIAVVIRAKYENGKFSIFYNPYLKDHIQNIEKNFTKLSLSIMTSFRSVYSFRLYELLKSQCYSQYQSKYDENKYIISFSLSELKLSLGVVNAALDSVKKVLKSEKSPDFDKAVEVSPEKKFQSWREFKRWVLDASINEINSYDEDGNYKTDIEVTYDTVKQGRGGKVCTVIFTVTKRELTHLKKKQELTEDEKDAFIDEIAELITDVKLKLKDMRALAEASDYNIEKLKKAYELSKNSNIDNLVGWLIKAMKEDYDAVASPRSNPVSNEFNSFEQLEYDFDEIEKAIIDN